MHEFSSLFWDKQPVCYMQLNFMLWFSGTTRICACTEFSIQTKCMRMRGGFLPRFLDNQPKNVTKSDENPHTHLESHPHRFIVTKNNLKTTRATVQYCFFFLGGGGGGITEDYLYISYMSKCSKFPIIPRPLHFCELRVSHTLAKELGPS